MESMTMPSRSPEQAKTMSAIAHGWRPTGSAAGIPVKVAKEFACQVTSYFELDRSFTFLADSFR